MNAKDIAFSVIGVGMFAIVFFLIRGPVDQNIGIQTSGITGQVTLSPLCPVEQFPPEPQCLPKPYETVVTVSSAEATSFITSVTTDADGSFFVPLAPGTYTVLPEGGNVFPACTSSTVEVSAEIFTHIDLSCDTGIR